MFKVKDKVKTTRADLLFGTLKDNYIKEGYLIIKQTDDIKDETVFLTDEKDLVFCGVPLNSLVPYKEKVKVKEEHRSTFEQYEPSYGICECGGRLGWKQKLCTSCGREQIWKISL